MGNYITLPQSINPPSKSSNASGKGKVILLDGAVYVFDEPLTVAELMLEHPQQVVVELTGSQGTLTQKTRRPSPLPADKKLEAKKVYMMLPMRRGKVVSLSSEEARHVLSSADKVLRSRVSVFSPRFLPLFARICPVGGGEGDSSKFVVENKGIKENNNNNDNNNNNNRLEINVEEEVECMAPEYLTRQVSGKGWKPSLDTIKENNLDKVKMPHWLF